MERDATGVAIPLGNFLNNETKGYGGYFHNAAGSFYEVQGYSNGPGATLLTDSDFQPATPPSWVHVAVEYKSATHYVYTYVNGTLAGSFAATSGPADPGRQTPSGLEAVLVGAPVTASKARWTTLAFTTMRCRLQT